ncbi:hypothetical protein CDAR_39201 [Caerostris darwini]|uniref:Tudor domain-containing protein n=1 Tax=Caerostris darwini TaxID=1538125 RepID=A0AAV4QY17_9ARAC|nr:hypothetical protein CDAR_39201 [Caerostris darwini]
MILSLFMKNLLDYVADDTESIQAEGMNECAKKESNGESINKERKKWKLHDICRAVYCGDQLYHEAKIVHIQRKFCLVQFLDNDEVYGRPLYTLRESLGKHAQVKQITSAFEQNEDSVTENENEVKTSIESENLSNRKKQDGSNSTDVRSCKEKRKQSHENQNAQPNTVSNANQSLGKSCPYMPPPTQSHIVCPKLPHMLQNSACAIDPHLCAMMMDYYKAGYYAGLNAATQNPNYFNHDCGHG